MKYPHREPHFAHKFTRLLFRSCTASEIGIDAVWLCIAVVHTEDSKRYSGPVTFWDQNLSDQLGMSPSSLHRARLRAVRAGWLHYEVGVRGKAARYWVTVPIDEQGKPDKQLGESEAEFLSQPDRESDRESDGETPIVSQFLSQRDRESDRETEFLSQPDRESEANVTDLLPLSLSLRHKNGLSALSDHSSKAKKPRPKKPSAKEPESFARFWLSYPRKEKRSVALASWVKLDPSPELVETILADVKRRSTSPAWLESGGRFTPHPNSYLHQKRWEDEAPAPPARKPDFVCDDLNPPSYPPMQFAKRREPK